jgi:hypothetical protein
MFKSTFAKSGAKIKKFINIFFYFYCFLEKKKEKKIESFYENRIKIKQGRMLTMLSKEQEMHQIRLKCQRIRIKNEYDEKTELLALDNKQLVYDNQMIAAKKIIEHFKNGKSLVQLVAQPGSGKTGVGLQVLYEMTTDSSDKDCILSENTYCVSGMDDTDWTDQFKSCILPSFQERVYHRSLFKKNGEKTDKFPSLTNGFLLTDECHYASGAKQTMAKVLKSAGLLDIDVLEARKVKMLEISATPDSVLSDAEAWKEKAAVVFLNPDPKYKGLKEMYNEGRILDAPYLEDYNETFKYFDLLTKRYIGTTPKYHIFRTIDAEILANINKACVKFGWANPIVHNSEFRKSDIDKIMSEAPTKHTPIIIKKFWAASKRLVDTHVGSTYKNTKSKDTTVSAQDLPARFAFNGEYSGDQVDVNFRPLHFCDKAAIKQYIDWFDKGCDYKKSNYDGSRIKSKDGKIKKSKNSKIHKSIVAGLSEVSSESDSDKEEASYGISDGEPFTSRDDAKKWCKNNLQSQYRSSAYRVYNSLNERTTIYAGDAVKFIYRSNWRDIETCDKTCKAKDLGGGVRGEGGSARITPVYKDETKTQIAYIVVYDKDQKI